MAQNQEALFGVSEFTTHPWPFERDVETFARLGVGAIEVCEFKLDPDRIDAQMRLPAAHGLQITSVQPKTRTLYPSKSQPEPKEIGERMGLFRKTIEQLAPYTPGVAYVTNTGIPPDGNIQKALDTAVDEYGKLADFAAGHGVRVALEPLNASIMNIESAIWTLQQGMEVVRAVGRDNFGICLDCWNIWQNADLAEAIRAAGDRIYVVQVSDWRTPRSFQDRLIPGQGAIPLASFLRTVRETGYAGAYSVEIFSKNVPAPLWEGDLEQVVRDSKKGFEAAWKEAGF
jgi:sugar phosphate isomerase/epimerase